MAGSADIDAGQIGPHGQVDGRHEIGLRPALHLQHGLEMVEHFVARYAGKRERAPRDTKGDAQSSLVGAMTGDVTEHDPHRAVVELDGVEEVAAEQRAATAGLVPRRPSK